MNCLVVERDHGIAEMISLGIGNLFNNVDKVSEHRAALSSLMTKKYDLILMDSNCQDKDHLDFIDEIKRMKKDISMMIISARDDFESRAQAYDHGIEDFMPKPFTIRELQARTCKVINRCVSKRVIESCGPIMLNRVSRKVTVAGKNLDLLDREFEMMELFCDNVNVPLTKKKILKALWNYDFDPKTNIVDVMICRLRMKMEEAGCKNMIGTVRSVGYVLRLHS